jgi:hypothetical protein
MLASSSFFHSTFDVGRSMFILSVFDVHFFSSPRTKTTGAYAAIPPTKLPILPASYPPSLLASQLPTLPASYLPSFLPIFSASDLLILYHPCLYVFIIRSEGTHPNHPTIQSFRV